MKLQNIRTKIDLLDTKILKLLNDRMEQAIMSKKFKKEIKDSGREEQLLDNLKKNSRGLINPDFVAKLYEQILNESRNLQAKDYKIIGFQGEHGAYSEMAAKGYDNNMVPVPTKTFNEVFELVSNETYDYGIVPVENTLGGNVGQVNNLLINTDLHVIGAVELPVHHCLLALPGSDHREIRQVYSHYQALSQCRMFLKRNKLEPVNYYDTAGSAKMLMENGQKNVASIASKLSAELYNLDIIKENIEDLDANRTRFLVISKTANKDNGNKCSINFSTTHKAGTLFKVLEVFASRGVSLTRIESIPSHPGEYTFFIDFLGSDKDEKVTEALKIVKEQTKDYKFMGCYTEKKL